MQNINLKILATIVLFLVACAEEKNPYNSQIVQGTSNAAPKGDQDVDPNHSDSEIDDASRTKAMEPVVEQKPPVVADVKSVPPETLNFAQMICDDKEYTAKYAIEMGVFCVSGKPSQTLVDAIGKPYKGQGTPMITTVKSQDVNRVSHFIIVSSVEVPKGQKDIFAARGVLNNGTTVGTNATLIQRQVAELPLTPGLLANYEISMDLAIRVGGLTVDERAVAIRDYAMVKEGNFLKSANYLKAGEEDNENKVGNLLSFWLSEGGTTKIVGVTHQQAPNRGRHEVAVEVIQGIARKTLVDTYTNLSK